MKSRVRFPFVYFYTEPNMVYAYKMDSTDYITVSNWSSSGEWRSFEVDSEEAFETFKHEETQPPEGLGMFISQDVLYKMVEEINNNIQQYRSLLACKPFSRNPFKEVNGVHIVSSESAAGSVRGGLESPKLVIGFTENLAIGPLWNLDQVDGQAYRKEWLFDHINSEQEEDEGENKFRNMQREIEDIPEQLPIYIWYGNNAFEQVFLRFVLSITRYKSNEIYLINSAERKYITNKDEHEEEVDTDQFEPQDVRAIYEKREELQPLTKQERNQYQKEWETLSQTKNGLRIWRDQRIIEVNENYYDELILRTIKTMHQEQEQKDYIMTAEVIGEILYANREYIYIDFLEYRIRDLVFSGILELKGVPKSMRHYRVKLRA